jgi:hypothetical protein
VVVVFVVARAVVAGSEVVVAGVPVAGAAEVVVAAWSTPPQAATMRQVATIHVPVRMPCS